MEIWKEIIDYEEYQVSDQGRVRNSREMILKQSIKKSPRSKTSYQRVNLCKDGIVKNFFVHRLVCIAFLPNPENKRTVNHLDENGLNNCLTNLEWATDSEQQIHSPSPIGASGHRNIHINKFGNYKVQIQRENISVFRKNFKTVQEAIEARDAILATL